MYANQVATLIWWSLQEVGASRRPVVLSLALDRGHPGYQRDGTRSLNGEVNGEVEAAGMIDDQDGGSSIGIRERQRFEGIMGMVAAWPGPQSTSET